MFRKWTRQPSFFGYVRDLLKSVFVVLGQNPHSDDSGGRRKFSFTKRNVTSRHPKVNAVTLMGTWLADDCAKLASSYPNLYVRKLLMVVLFEVANR